MIDLSPVCGLPVSLNAETCKLEFGEGVEHADPGVRTLDQIRPLLANPDITEPRELYYMYRDVRRSGDERAIRDTELRYDISSFRPVKLGEEWMKTSGHYHPYVADSRLITFPEVYEILHGRVLFLLQRPDDVYAGPARARLDDAMLIEVRAGEKVVMPPNYGHIGIIPGPEPLVMSNWVAACFTSTYHAIELGRGGAYYFFDRDGELDPRPNPVYAEHDNVPPLRRGRPVERPDLGLAPASPMYDACISAPSVFEYLTRPQDHLSAFDGVFTFEDA